MARNRREELARGKLSARIRERSIRRHAFTPRRIRMRSRSNPSLATLLAERGFAVTRVDLRRVVDMSAALEAKLADVFTSFRSGATAAEHRARLKEFIGALVNEIVEREVEEQAPVGTVVAVSPAERVREYLELDPSARTDLQALSNRTGLSRFQVLRAFRSSYGFAPHAYKLCVRIGLAQKALRRGLRPPRSPRSTASSIKATSTRHFKRLVGVTPLNTPSLGLGSDEHGAPKPHEAGAARRDKSPTGSTLPGVSVEHIPVAVLGAGLAGLSAAESLARRGVSRRVSRRPAAWAASW